MAFAVEHLSVDDLEEQVRAASWSGAIAIVRSTAGGRT